MNWKLRMQMNGARQTRRNKFYKWNWRLGWIKNLNAKRKWKENNKKIKAKCRVFLIWFTVIDIFRLNSYEYFFILAAFIFFIAAFFVVVATIMPAFWERNKRKSCFNLLKNIGRSYRRTKTMQFFCEFEWVIVNVSWRQLHDGCKFAKCIKKLNSQFGWWGSSTLGHSEDEREKLHRKKRRRKIECISSEATTTQYT